MTRIIQFWLRGSPTARPFKDQVEKLDYKINKYRQSCVVEFAGRPRSIQDIDWCKPSELRQFLLYYGPLLMTKHNKWKNATRLTDSIISLIDHVFSNQNLKCDVIDYKISDHNPIKANITTNIKHLTQKQHTNFTYTNT